MPDAGQLDPEQAEVARADAADRRIVLAPPGSGKTEVVAARNAHLVEEQGLDPYDELLVISFSRAAVDALRRRAADRVQVAGLPIRTIDGVASLVLSESGVAGWEAWSFDHRVDLAIQQLHDNGPCIALEATKHIVVDEVQDVVGRRARLVLDLLERLPADGGFTLLGDPHQAIYDFQLRDEPGGMTSHDLLVKAESLGPVRTSRLRGQYRASTPDTRKLTALGRSDLTGEARVKEVRTFIAGVDGYGELHGIARAIKRWQGTTAVLCQTNGEALVVADLLRVAGVPVLLRAKAEELPLVPWIAQSLGGLQGTNVTKETAMPLLERAPSGPEEAWRTLKSIERDYRAPKRLDLARLASKLAGGVVPSELRGGDGDLVVSTVHRAKGLEFDHVVLVNKNGFLPAGATQEQAAVAYVSLTRARQRIVGATVELPKPLFRDQTTDRWVLGGHQKWMTKAFEVRGVDVDPAWAPEGLTLSRTGDHVVARVSKRFSTMETPVFELSADGTTFGRTTQAFGEILARRLGGPRKSGRPWPDISGLGVDSLATVIPPFVGTGPRFRLGVRVSGLGALQWNGVRDG